MTELNWRPIPGWENLYEVSDLGRVRSLDREQIGPNGKCWTRRGRILKQFSSHARHNLYKRVELCSNPDDHQKIAVHRLVAWAFIGPQASGIFVRHLNGDPRDNRLANLAYGTPSENIQDMLRHGTCYWSERPSCKNGHEFTESNTSIRNGIRHCRTCARERQHRYRLAKDPSVKPRRLEPAERAEVVKGRLNAQTHCKRGHPFSTENTYVTAYGYRQCRACQLIAVESYQRRKKAKKS